ncbi:DUF3800 domain-containing protein [Pseudenhygromyxa sp. WMMC2535]|uniref:DUF3800 domain-containing protein n=1 Tax=Pseudenhygromyxa sp. WMMC2535 TaxID=2712867 RepID=UPI001552F2D5|nr:DUF3800 domain-containing protein [Pseudenhygromyxa sp. WMMC2535]NVB40323.1 DUF3800 domain-containing protein [Pseudenhygromyxa sp. WMMC2535]
MGKGMSYTQRLRSRTKQCSEAWVFCDESGNSGINYLAPESPFLVLAGFIVAGSARRRAEAAVRSFVEDLGLPGGKEPKFRDVWRKSRQPRTLAMLRDLGKARAVPVFYFMQKQFAIAGKVVDVLLDPMHNPGASWLPTASLRERRRLTELVYTASDGVLRDFAEAYRDPSENAPLLESCLERLSRFAGLNGEPLLEKGFRGALESLDAIIDAEDCDSADGGKHAEHASLNVPALTQFMRKCDMGLDMYRPRQGTLVHDEQSQFRRVFEFYARMLRKIGVGHRELEDVLDAQGIPVDRVGVRNIHCFSMRDSRGEPLLLAADILAGGIARVLKQVLDDEPWSDAELRFAAMTLPGLLGERKALSSYYADDGFVGKVLARLSD